MAKKAVKKAVKKAAKKAVTKKVLTRKVMKKTKGGLFGGPGVDTARVTVEGGDGVAASARRRVASSLPGAAY